LYFDNYFSSALKIEVSNSFEVASAMCETIWHSNLEYAVEFTAFVIVDILNLLHFMPYLTYMGFIDMKVKFR
jgi:hypothetical protein